MAQENFNVSLPNDGLGDALRDAFVKQQNMNTELYNTKVDKVIGKDLSSNDYTDTEKTKLAGIEEGAQVNVPINYTDIIGAPIFNNIAAYPETKYDYLDTNVFTIPENVQAITVRKNGDSTDNLEYWTQFGDEVTYLGTLTAGDYLIIGGVFVIPSGGGGTPSDLITKFTSNPIPSIVGTDILVPEDETWLIDSVPYTNPTVSTIPFSYAPDGLLYFLTVVATKFNTFIGKIGTASTDPSEPIVNNDELFLTTYLISDGTIEVVIPPVNPNIYVEKESFAPLTLISSGHVASIEIDKRNNLIFSGNITKTGNVIKNNPNHFVIGLPFMTTNRTSNLIEIEHMNTSGGSGAIGFFNTEETSYFLQPNEVAIWISEILNGQKIHRRVSSYIDRDNVIYRSGTKTGKPVTGDVEIGNGTSLVTEEVGGVKSHLYASEGIWIIEITDGIDNLYINFHPNKGIFSDKLFDLENDENAYLQKGHIIQLEEDVFNLGLNKADLVGGLVPSSQLPAYVDDILEFSNLASFPAVGEIGKIYIAISPSNLQYRWTGSAYVAITNGFIASTDDVPEGSNNLHFTTARVLSTLLTGISFLTGGAIVSTDSVLVAFGKLQKQLNDFGTALGLKQDTLTDTNFGTFTNSTDNKNIQANTDVLAYVDVTTGKWVKQTFSKLVDYLKGFFQTSRIIVTSNITAVNGSVYHNNGNNTFTDPTPENNRGYYVLNISGSPTIGGNAQSVGTYIFRYYDGTNWINNTIKKGVSNAVYSANKTLTPMDNNDTIFMDSGTLTVNPTAQAYQNGYTIAGKSSGIANTPIVLQSATDWTYVINSNAPIASASVFAEKGGTFTIVRKANLKIFSIDGSVI